MVLYKYKDKQEGEQMRTNKTISIDIDVLKEMLEEARELMVKSIELYGFNDEVTIASSVLVDKILNKEGAECEKSS